MKKHFSFRQYIVRTNHAHSILEVYASESICECRTTALVSVDIASANVNLSFPVNSLMKISLENVSSECSKSPK